MEPQFGPPSRVDRLICRTWIIERFEVTWPMLYLDPGCRYEKTEKLPKFEFFRNIIVVHLVRANMGDEIVLDSLAYVEEGYDALENQINSLIRQEINVMAKKDYLESIPAIKFPQKVCSIFSASKPRRKERC